MQRLWHKTKACRRLIRKAVDGISTGNILVRHGKSGTIKSPSKSVASWNCGIQNPKEAIDLTKTDLQDADLKMPTLDADLQGADLHVPTSRCQP